MVGGRRRGRGRGVGGRVCEKEGRGGAFVRERRIFFNNGFEDVGGFVGRVDGVVVFILMVVGCGDERIMLVNMNSFFSLPLPSFFSPHLDMRQSTTTIPSSLPPSSPPLLSIPFSFCFLSLPLFHSPFFSFFPFFFSFFVPFHL